MVCNIVARVHIETIHTHAGQLKVTYILFKYNKFILEIYIERIIIHVLTCKLKQAH